MDPNVRAFVVSMARSLLPAPDPVRRRRVRTAARRLVDCDPWPADDATTGSDVAKLALLHLMYLQRQTRREVSFRNGEAAVRLARSSIEACLLGLYALHEPDVVEQLKGGHLKSMRGMLGYLVDDGLVTQEIVDQSAAAMGPAAHAPGVWAMADRVDAATSGNGAVSLYRRFYVPTSALFVHVNAPSLLRHVGRDGKLTKRPSFPWTLRSVVRVSDACVGILAAAVAAHESKPADALEEYANAHLSLALTPVGVVVARGLFRSVRLSQLPTLVGTLRELRQYAQSPQAAADSPQAREARLADGFDQLVQPLRPGLPDDVVRVLREWFVDRLVEAIDEREGELANGSGTVGR
ncbi:hypothetical protein AB0F96_37085 [Streptomyces sp. NPDC023998]|uniref:hypothetical protein n=1 Tax=Streptomyces sp. NPDC023998 TaxID=3154597 RepID=UPI0033CA4F64